MLSEGEKDPTISPSYDKRPVGWTPEPVSIPNIHLSKEDYQDIINEVVSYRATRHRIIAMTEAQYRAFYKKDVYGGVEIASYIKFPKESHD